jgi:diguanylate cyclase (GGDEF)-like protein
VSERKHNASRRWSLWSLARPVLWYVLVVDASAVAATAASGPSPVGLHDLQVGGAIAAAMLVHLYLARDSERVHRTRRRSPHVDLGWVWAFPGAVLLPWPLAVGLALLMCAQRWWLFARVDGRPPHRRLFNAAVWVLSTLAAGFVVTVSGRREHLAGDPGGWLDLVTIVLAAAVAYALNAGLVAGVLALATGARRPRELFGDAGENLLDAGTLLLGACVVLTVAWWPPLVALIILPAVVLHRTVLIQHLEAAARTDEKTGVLNSVAWHEQARSALARAQRADRAAAVLMIDLDGFKQVNDEHGHLVGDAVLQRVADVLATEVRQCDAVGRVGGDEFAVLLPATDVSAALAVAERIRRAVRELAVPVSGGLSTSIGVAVHPLVADGSAEGLLAAADAALYEAKDNGRDRVCLAGKVTTQRVRMPWWEMNAMTGRRQRSG